MPDFSPSEYRARFAQAQALMAAEGFDALLFMTDAELRYFTGFRSLFWQSPTRPWFLVLPVSGDPIAIIPRIGADLMGKTWITNILTWASPDPVDDGITLLTDVLKGANRIGMPMGPETSLRMPLVDFERLRQNLPGEIHDATSIIKALRMVKSAAEIELIGDICSTASRAFDRAGELFSRGQALNEAFRAFKIALLNEGAEDVPYVVGSAGQGGYGDVISPPSDLPLAEGDVLMLDTGAVKHGYFCDFDRNFAIGSVAQSAKDAHFQLWDATEAGLHAAVAGATCADLYAAMAAELPSAGGDVGRLGHGLGLQLTEWPSLTSWDHTELKPGMVMTLEPSMEIGPGRMMVAEENIVITDGAPIMLSKRASRDIPVI